jgi:hypothetical protein
MDNETLKSLILQYRDSGMTYQEISDKLVSEYGIMKSRQAIQGLYKRTVQNLKSDSDKIKRLREADVVNLYCLGYNMSEVQRLMEDLGYDISYSEVNRIIKRYKKEDDYIKEVEDSIVSRIRDIADKVSSIDDIINNVNYKGVSIKKEKVLEYLVEAYKNKIIDRIREDLIKIYEFTDSKGAVKKIIDDLKLDIKINELKRTL